MQGGDMVQGRWRGRGGFIPLAGAGAIAAASMVCLTGCGQMASALDQQWIVVDFQPNTTVATALHVREACSHIQNTPAMALPPKRSVLDTMYGIRYNTTNSSTAEVAELQECLQKFSSVQGLDPEDVGDEGS
jgi:hypothetical protein